MTSTAQTRIEHPRTAGSPARGFPVGWVFITAMVGLAAGFAAGYWAGRRMDDPVADLTPTSREPRAEVVVAPEPPQVISKYREELFRLRQARNRDSTALKEKELTLQMMELRGIGPDGSACRRLDREIHALRIGIARTDERLEELREQLLQLTAVRDAAHRQDDGLDERTKVDARRMVMEHDAGLVPQ